jgi:sugar/nucleoside kinase (ribokinase family)
VSSSRAAALKSEDTVTTKADEWRAEATRDALGGGGCYYQRATSSGHLSGIAVESVDSLGAGDTFVAGLLACLSVDRDFGVVGECDALVPALRFAKARGTRATSTPCSRREPLSEPAAPTQFSRAAAPG